MEIVSDSKNKIMYLDIETMYLMTDFPNGWKNPENYRNVKIAELGILQDNKYTTFEENNIYSLVSEFKKVDLIVGHNINQFDSQVLKYYLDEKIMKEFRNKLFDTMIEFKKFTPTASWVSLNDIAKRNFGMTKTEESIKIPQMWREGKHDEVKAYLYNDLLMTEKFYLHGKKGHTFKYEHKEYSKSYGEREVYVRW